MTALKGDWPTLIHEFLHECPNLLPHRPDQDEQQQGQMLQRAAQRGCTAKAWRILKGHGLVRDQEAAWHEVCAKLRPHAHLPQPQMPPDDLMLENPLTVDDYNRRIAKLRSNKAMDAYGWSHENMQFLWAHKPLREQVRQWVHELYGMYSPEPDRQHGLLSKVVMLAKSAEGGCRPILLEPLWLKVWTGALAWQLQQVTKELLIPRQVGLGCPNGTAIMQSILTRAMSMYPQAALLKIDIENAFGCIDRNAMIAVLRKHLPPTTWQKYGPALQMYLHSPICVLPGSLQSGEVLYTHDGVAQGDPLSTWMFSASLTWTLQDAMPMDAPAAWVSYIDDTAFAGEAWALDIVWKLLPEALGRLGLQLQKQKSTVYWPHPQPLADAAPLLAEEVPHIHHAGVIVCGHVMADSEENIAIGVEGFLQTWLEQMIARLQAQLMRMRRLAPHMGPHSKQIQAKLALSLVPAQIMHILRSYPCMVLRQFVEQVDDLQKDFWCYLASTSTSLTAHQWRLLTLPPSKGGLGLTSAMAIAPIARLTALVQFPKHGDLGEHARRLWEHEAPMLYDQVSSAMKAPIALLVRQSWDHDDPSSVRMLFKKLRGHFSILTAHEFLAAHADDASPMGHVWRSSLQEDQLDSVSMHQRGAEWLVPTQLGPDTSLHDDAWTWNLQWRLGIAFQAQFCQRIDKHGLSCAQPLDVHHQHAFGCSHCLLIKRHNLIRDIFASMAKAAGALVHVEQRTGHGIMQDLEGTLRHRPLHTADVVATLPDGRSITMDIRVTTRPPHQGLRSWLTQSETKKRAEYGMPPLEPHASLFTEVQPVVIEVAGKLADRAQLLLQHLAELIVAKGSKEQLVYRSVALHHTTRLYATKIAVALARYRYLAVKACHGSTSAEATLLQESMSQSPATSSPSRHANTRKDSSSWRGSSFTSDVPSPAQPAAQQIRRPVTTRVDSSITWQHSSSSFTSDGQHADCLAAMQAG